MLDLAEVKLGDTIPGDLYLYAASGEKAVLASVAKDKYTVIVSGCLTCPIFHRSYVGIEAVYADYKNREEIQFFFMYKSLAHPEYNGYVQAATLEERLVHIKEAKRVLGTTIPWLCDGMDNQARHRLGFGPNTQIVIDPNGKVIHTLGWSDGDALRQELIGRIGDSETRTSAADLQLKKSKPYRTQRAYEPTVVKQPSFDTQLLPVITRPSEADDKPLYVKPRVEVEPSVLQGRPGRLFLGFYLDPIHDVHWNNLADPLRYELILPDGSVITPASDIAPKIENADSDGDPRLFALEVSSLGETRDATLAIHYFACSKTEGWCVPVTQKYDIAFSMDRDGGGTMGRSFRVGGGGGNRQRGFAEGRGSAGGQRGGNGGFSPEQMKERLLGMDENGDGKIDLASELPERARQRMERADVNGDGFIDGEEMDRMTQAMGRQRGGGPGQAGRGPRGNIKERLLRQDANEDGKLSRDEIPEQMLRRFDGMDANGDGFVDEAEIDQAVERLRGQPRRGGPGRGAPPDDSAI